ncbi:hypothetical protein LJR289_002072 [Pseudoduganella sp. LjRoot289]|uniref:hypothetical protein n=1 Tax=Pseudoduganella sp. LjRoot289 TaxID=3342314 RepID=UPI003ECF9595
MVIRPPSMHAEDALLRVLDKTALVAWVADPTASGKTEINHGEDKFNTIEDPA